MCAHTVRVDRICMCSADGSEWRIVVCLDIPMCDVMRPARGQNFNWPKSSGGFCLHSTMLIAAVIQSHTRIHAHSHSPTHRSYSISSATLLYVRRNVFAFGRVCIASLPITSGSNCLGSDRAPDRNHCARVRIQSTLGRQSCGPYFHPSFRPKTKTPTDQICSQCRRHIGRVHIAV